LFSRLCHRDLSSRNILLDLNVKPKITDFGLSRFHEEKEKSGTTRSDIGPIRWMAPESIIKKKVYFKSWN
jgi:serine/threonine protein kinase